MKKVSSAVPQTPQNQNSVENYGKNSKHDKTITPPPIKSFIHTLPSEIKFSDILVALLV